MAIKLITTTLLVLTLTTSLTHGALAPSGGGGAVAQAKLNQQLFTAIQGRNQARVTSLIQAKADVNAQDGLGDTSLHHAVQVGDAGIIGLLLGSRADSTIQNIKGLTALALAQNTQRNNSLVSLLAEHSRVIAAAAKVVVPARRKRNVCCSRPSLRLIIAAVLLKIGIVKNVCERIAAPFPQIFLHPLCDYVPLIQPTITPSPIQPTITPSPIPPFIPLPMEVRYQQLLEAIKRGDIAAVNYLIAIGVDVNKPGHFDHVQTSPFLEAVEHGNTALIEILLKAGANIEAEIGGVKPLYRAAQYGNTEAVQALLKAKADVNARPILGGPTPLNLVACRGDKTIVEMLLGAGANKKAAMDDNDNRTPLDMAKECGNKEIIAILSK